MHEDVTKKQWEKEKLIFEVIESFQTGLYIFSLKNMLFWGTQMPKYI